MSSNTIRSEHYGEEVRRLQSEGGQHIQNMADDLSNSSLTVEDISALAFNERYFELSGDRGKFIGSVKEAVQEIMNGQETGS